MRSRLQMVMSTGTLVLGLYLALSGDADFAVFGWFVVALGCIGLLAPIVLTGLAQRP